MEKRQADSIDQGTPNSKPAVKRVAVESGCTPGESGESTVARPLDFDRVEREAEDPDRPPSWFLRFFEGFEKRLEEKITKKLDAVCVKVKEHDDVISACTLQIESLEKEIKALKKEKSSFEIKLDDLENRSRRCNIVFHGIKEAPKENCHAVVQDMLTKFVGLAAEDFVIERCHRTPTTPLPRAEKDVRPPRIVHAAFSSYSTKEKVRKACVAKFKEESFNGNKIFVSDDYSKRVLNMRKEKMEKFKKLKEESRKPFFLYPDRLAYRSKDGKLHFVD